MYLSLVSYLAEELFLHNHQKACCQLVPVFHCFVCFDAIFRNTKLSLSHAEEIVAVNVPKFCAISPSLNVENGQGCIANRPSQIAYRPSCSRTPRQSSDRPANNQGPRAIHKLKLASGRPLTLSQTSSLTQNALFRTAAQTEMP